MRNLLNSFSYLTLIITFLFVCVVSYWWFYPYKPIVYLTPQYKIMNENKTATVGGQLVYQVNYCKYVDVIPTITKRYVDGILYDTPQSKGVVARGCHITNVYNTVPETLVPGTYKMDLVIDYQMNPIRHIIYNNQTEEFTIIKK